MASAVAAETAGGSGCVGASRRGGSDSGGGRGARCAAGVGTGLRRWRGAGSSAGGKGVGKRSRAQVNGCRHAGATKWRGWSDGSEWRIECNARAEKGHAEGSEPAQSAHARRQPTRGAPRKSRGGAISLDKQGGVLSSVSNRCATSGRELNLQRQ